MKFLNAKIALLLASLLLLNGCESASNMTQKLNDKIHGDDDAVIVTFEADGVKLKARPSSNKHCIDGLRHFRNQDWDKAKAELELAVQKNPKDDRAQFACGIACEKLGDFKGALEHYKAANFIKGEIDYDASRLRVEEKIKK